MAVSFLRYGQGNDRDLWFTHRCQYAFQTINLRMQCIFHHAHDSRSPGISRHLCNGIQIILLFQIENLLLAANQIHFAVAPVTAVICSQNVSVNPLMCAVKRAKPQMNNTRNQFCTIVVRKCSLCR
ncbi:hypothetical protein SDC9_211280 [bioreactor metagenome]|uniref:Uncharacterized protein n=1 Tax=bioreactor metagenome TaxID=1076179 RepID=A0A645JJA7_9ZZZZ